MRPGRKKTVGKREDGKTCVKAEADVLYIRSFGTIVGKKSAATLWPQRVGVVLYNGEV